MRKYIKPLDSSASRRFTNRKQCARGEPVSFWRENVTRKCGSRRQSVLAKISYWRIKRGKQVFEIKGKFILLLIKTMP